jgi:hypothetical protein
MEIPARCANLNPAYQIHATKEVHFNFDKGHGACVIEVRLLDGDWDSRTSRFILDFRDTFPDLGREFDAFILGEIIGD